MPNNPDRRWLDPFAPSRFSEMISNFEGKSAIMKEQRHVNYVRVSNIVADDWGVRAHNTLIPTPGMLGLGEGNRETSEISAAWLVFSFRAKDWYAMYVAWKIYFDPDLIEKVVALAAEAAKEGTIIDDRTVLRALAALEHAQQSSLVDPGRTRDT
jgi:hypothetical protein